MLSAVLAVLSFTTMLKTEEFGVLFEIEEDSFFVNENPIWIGKFDSLFSCSQMCAREPFCKSANYMTAEETCSLHRETRKMYPDRLLKQKGSSYIEKVFSGRTPASSSFQDEFDDFDGFDEIPTSEGSAQPPIMRSCRLLTYWDPHISSGVYWIDPNYGSRDPPFQAYCDMDTDGGGWTLVWSYTFTNYSHFTDESNAITPRPNWPASEEVDVSVSTTPPLNETDYNAIDFSLWKILGSEILIKSNINNWLACSPSGSLVYWRQGNTDCVVVGNITGTCLYEDTDRLTLAPSETCGPKFRASGTFFHFDGCTKNSWPVHDPCGRGHENNLKNVINPHGSIFVR